MRLIFIGLSVIIAVVLIKICNTTTTVNYDEYCPEGYNRIAGTPICILITTNSSYANECLKSGSTPTEYYAEMIEGNSQVIRNYLVAEKIEEVWLPIKRNVNHFLVWDLPGPIKQNGRVTEISLENTPTEYSSGQCIVYNNNVQKIHLEDCDRFYRLMCLVDTRESFVVPHALCDSKFIGRLSKFHDLCFTITDYGVENPATINSKDTFVLIDQLIGQLNKQNEAILVYDPLSASPDSSAFKLGRIQIIDKHSATKQVVQKQHNTTNRPSINIAFNSITSRIIVFVTNYDSLWNPKNPEIPFWCYSELDLAGDSELESQYTVLRSSKTNKIFGKHLPDRELGFATIWCEGQMLKSFEIVQSKRLIIEYNGDAEYFILCAKLEQNCNPPPCKIVTELEKFNTNVTAIKGTSFKEFEVFQVQTKQILSLDQNSITLLLHFVLRFYDANFPNKTDGFETGISKFIADDSKLTEIQMNNCALFNNYFPSAELNEKTLYEPPRFYSHGVMPSEEGAKHLIKHATFRKMLNTSIHNDLEKRRVGIGGGHSKMVEEYNKRGREAFAFINAPSRSFVNFDDTWLTRATLKNFEETRQLNVSDRKFDGKSGTPITNMLDKIPESKTEPLKIKDRNTVLATINKLTLQFINSNTFESNVMLGDDGVRIIQIKNFSLVFVNPLIKNITGIELHRKSSDVQNFNNFTIKTFNKNHRIEDTNTEDDTPLLMAHVTSEEFNKTKITKDNDLVAPNRLIFLLYYKSSLFEEEFNDSAHIIQDYKVIGISLPNFPMHAFPEGVITMFKTFSETMEETGTNDCSEIALKSTSKKDWDILLWGKNNETKNIMKCKVRCHGNIEFTKLVGLSECDSENQIVKEVDYTVIIGCTLSILGLTLIFMTATFNPGWQQSAATPLILNVSASSMFLIVTNYVLQIFRNVDCTILGVFVHCAVLVGFFVSAIMTNWQYRRYAVKFRNPAPKHLNLQLHLFGWLVPSLIVALCFGLAFKSYEPLVEVRQPDIFTSVTTIACFPNTTFLYVGVHIPIVVIFCYNFSIYVWIIRRVRQETPNLGKTSSKTTVFLQIRLFMELFLILSITWIFALLHHYTKIQIYEIIFNVASATQGLCLAAFCLAVHQETRNFWVQKLKCSNE